MKYVQKAESCNEPSLERLSQFQPFSFYNKNAHAKDGSVCGMYRYIYLHKSLMKALEENSSEETDITKQIALQRIHTLFRLAKENVHENPELAQRYTEIARKIAMKTNLRLPREYRQLICRHCKSFVPPGVNCRVRIQSRRDPHVVVTCLKCGKHTRIPLERKRKNVNAQD